VFQRHRYVPAAAQYLARQVRRTAWRARCVRASRSAAAAYGDRESCPPSYLPLMRPGESSRYGDPGGQIHRIRRTPSPPGTVRAHWSCDECDESDETGLSAQVLTPGFPTPGAHNSWTWQGRGSCSLPSSLPCPSSKQWKTAAKWSGLHASQVAGMVALRRPRQIAESSSNRRQRVRAVCQSRDLSPVEMTRKQRQIVQAPRQRGGGG
jgi:hypothetical protein